MAVVINDLHPLGQHLHLLLQGGSRTAESVMDVLQLLLCAWGRVEAETQNETRRDLLSDLRTDWGRMVRDELNAGSLDRLGRTYGPIGGSS